MAAVPFESEHTHACICIKSDGFVTTLRIFLLVTIAINFAPPVALCVATATCAFERGPSLAFERGASLVASSGSKVGAGVMGVPSSMAPPTS